MPGAGRSTLDEPAASGSREPRPDAPGEAELRPGRRRRELAGVALMSLSYVIGWPAVGLLGAVSIRLEEPLVAIVGTPSLLVLSHLAFAAGLFLAGGRRLGAALRWLRRRGKPGGMSRTNRAAPR